MNANEKIDTTTTDGRAEISLRELESECKRLRTDIQYKARGLARTLNDVADNLHADPTYPPNSRGIVQWTGIELDQMCVLLAAKREEIKRANWVARGEQVKP